MKTIEYTCDTCKKSLFNNEFITLGSEDGNNLKFNNGLKAVPGQTIGIARYRDLHFCSKNCFTKYFFNKE